MRTVEVKLGAGGYRVVIGQGLLGRAGEFIGPLATTPVVLTVTDETVGSIHGAAFAEGLARAGLEGERLTCPPGEATKSFGHLADLCGRMVDAGLRRRDMIVALGGGVIGDLTGFAAAIYMRGVGYVQVPTTLLAQVDSSVGGKTAIDTPQGKNLVGAFHQPRLVLADLDVLATLPERQMRSGYAEVLKYALLGDAAFADWLELNAPAVLARDPAALEHAVGRCVEMKAQIVAGDERETNGGRALLNLGHTFAHALEAEAGMGEALLHGEAVAVGCAMAFRLSARLRLCDADAPVRVAGLVEQAGLASHLHGLAIGRFSAGGLLNRMKSDKKAGPDGLAFVLARRVGQAVLAPAVDAGVVLDFLREEGAEP